MPIDLDTIRAAHERIRPHVHRTPIFTCATISRLAGAEVLFKCENLQKIGAFKVRGAMNAVLSLTPEERAKGIATHSSGNHAQAVAVAARVVGARAFVVMPRTSARSKVEAVRGYGAQLTFCEPTLEGREETILQILGNTGAVFVHPFNDERVVAGQATSAKELIEDAGAPLDAIITPVGGGGLLSGTALSAHFLSPHTEVFAGEPEGAADAVYSLKSGKIEKAAYINTIADGLLTTLGDVTLPIIRKHVRDIFLVSDAEILAAMRLVYERMKLVIEPSAAVPLAALLKNRERFEGKRVAVVLSGGNVDLANFAEWFGSGHQRPSAS